MFIVYNKHINIKFWKILDTKNWYNFPKIGTASFYHTLTCSKDADLVTYSVDPDQTAPEGRAVWSGSTLFAQTCLII